MYAKLWILVALCAALASATDPEAESTVSPENMEPMQHSEDDWAETDTLENCYYKYCYEHANSSLAQCNVESPTAHFYDLPYGTCMMLDEMPHDCVVYQWAGEYCSTIYSHVYMMSCSAGKREEAERAAKAGNNTKRQAVCTQVAIPGQVCGYDDFGPGGGPTPYNGAYQSRINTINNRVLHTMKRGESRVSKRAMVLAPMNLYPIATFSFTSILIQASMYVQFESILSVAASIMPKFSYQASFNYKNIVSVPTYSITTKSYFGINVQTQFLSDYTYSYKPMGYSTTTEYIDVGSTTLDPAIAHLNSAQLVSVHGHLSFYFDHIGNWIVLLFGDGCGDFQDMPINCTDCAAQADRDALLCSFMFCSQGIDNPCAEPPTDQGMGFPGSCPGGPWGCGGNESPMSWFRWANVGITKASLFRTVKAFPSIQPTNAWSVSTLTYASTPSTANVSFLQEGKMNMFYYSSYYGRGRVQWKGLRKPIFQMPTSDELVILAPDECGGFFNDLPVRLGAPILFEAYLFNTAFSFSFLRPSLSGTQNRWQGYNYNPGTSVQAIKSINDVSRSDGKPVYGFIRRYYYSDTASWQIKQKRYVYGSRTTTYGTYNRYYTSSNCRKQRSVASSGVYTVSDTSKYLASGNYRYIKHLQSSGSGYSWQPYTRKYYPYTSGKYYSYTVSNGLCNLQISTLLVRNAAVISSGYHKVRTYNPTYYWYTGSLYSSFSYYKLLSVYVYEATLNNAYSYPRVERKYTNSNGGLYTAWYNCFVYSSDSSYQIWNSWVPSDREFRQNYFCRYYISSSTLRRKYISSSNLYNSLYYDGRYKWTSYPDTYKQISVRSTSYSSPCRWYWIYNLAACNTWYGYISGVYKRSRRRYLYHDGYSIGSSTSSWSNGFSGYYYYTYTGCTNYGK